MAKAKPNTIWYIDWDTESGDRGVIGYFTKKPTTAQLDSFMRRHFPDEFSYWCEEHGYAEMEGEQCPNAEESPSVYYSLDSMTEHKISG